MAYIQQRGDFWRVEVNRKGYKPAYHTFDTRKDAEKWARRTEAEMDAGIFVDKTLANRTTLAAALEKYRLKIVSCKLHTKQTSASTDGLSTTSPIELELLEICVVMISLNTVTPDEKTAAPKVQFGSNFRSSATYSSSPGGSGIWLD